MSRTQAPPLRGTLLLLSLTFTLSAQEPIRPRPGVDAYPPYTPVTRQAFTPVQLLQAQARWLFNQVWATGPVADAGTFLLPRSYDTTSGYGMLGTDYFSWLLEHNDTYYQFDLTHNDHLADVPKDHGNDAAIERVMMTWGSSIYDAATWDVAMAAAQACSAFTPEEKAAFTGALGAHLHALITASYPGGLRSYRAWDPEGAKRWHYGESGQDAAFGVDGQGRKLDARNAFYWQFSTPRWQNPDPHWDPLAPAGALMNWPAWNVITGEEAWAAFLGPLQVAFTLNQGRPGWSAANSPLQVSALIGNACRALHGVELMQNTVTGGVYREVGSPDASGPGTGAASVENNLSLYAGLGFLERALEDLRASLPDPAQTLDFDLNEAHSATRRIRKGIRAFLMNKARVWHAPGTPFADPAAIPFGFFLQGTTGLGGAATGVTSAFATDVQTWGIATILADRELERALAASLGADFLFGMFQAAVQLGGFYTPSGSGLTLAGIGYQNQKPGAPEALLSGEWTWGAINAAILLAEFYREPGHEAPAKAQALLDAARHMIDGVNRLASHDYNPGRLKDGRDWVGYLYAHRRGWIPWGWYANACPSQAATAWALLVNCGFNPFELGGGHHQATVKALGLAGH